MLKLAVLSPLVAAFLAHIAMFIGMGFKFADQEQS
jgi:hypothetical protein